MKNKKLGISYNVFDGEEILKFAIPNLRKFAHHVVVIYQTTSNFNNSYDDVEREVLRLKELGLIDEVYKYEPEILKTREGQIDWQSGWKNEITKRNIGLELCRGAGCDYYMTLDCDELYDHEEFEKAFDKVVKGDHDTSFSKIKTFYKKASLQVFPMEEHYQPFIYKIKEGVHFEYLMQYPVHVDHTKRMETINPLVFDRNELQQYHYAYVRNNIRRKVENSSAREPRANSEMVIERYEKWKEGDDALFIGMQHFKLEEVENKFNIEL